MIFGDVASLAVDAVPEPDPSMPKFVGQSLAGRLTVHLGGIRVGNATEPSCVFGPFANELESLVERAAAGNLWHASLQGLTAADVFQALDQALFVGPAESHPEAYGHMSFLTNSSEAFDSVKGFAIAAAPGSLLLLAQVGEGTEILTAKVQIEKVAAVAREFSASIKQIEAR